MKASAVIAMTLVFSHNKRYIMDPQKNPVAPPVNAAPQNELPINKVGKKGFILFKYILLGSCKLPRTPDRNFKTVMI